MSNNSLIDELEHALSEGTEGQRTEMLSRITDLFVADADRYSTAQVELFDELLTKLATAIETKARARLSGRLAAVPNAPTGVVRTLAFDDDIEVARPVLRQSSQVDEADLVTNATTKSQQHLLAISERKSLSEDVTDILVARGDTKVAHAVARNARARLSHTGYRMLVRRSSGDDDLASLVGTRPDVPRQQLLRLLDAASAEVRARLLAESPHCGGFVQNAVDEAVVRKAVDEVDNKIRSEIGGHSFDYATARRKVEALQRAGTLNEAAVGQFAREHKFEETAVALSLLCGVAIDVVERGLLSPGYEILLILVKIAGHSWATAKAILLMKASDRGMSPHDLDDALASFRRLNAVTARKVLSFYNMRSEGVAVPKAGQRG